jgi:hypothetical protein
MTMMTTAETSKTAQVSHTTGAALVPAPVRYCSGAAVAAVGIPAKITGDQQRIRTLVNGTALP